MQCVALRGAGWAAGKDDALDADQRRTDGQQPRDLLGTGDKRDFGFGMADDIGDPLGRFPAHRWAQPLAPRPVTAKSATCHSGQFGAFEDGYAVAIANAQFGQGARYARRCDAAFRARNILPLIADLVNLRPGIERAIDSGDQTLGKRGIFHSAGIKLMSTEPDHKWYPAGDCKCHAARCVKITDQGGEGWRNHR